LFGVIDQPFLAVYPSIKVGKYCENQKWEKSADSANARSVNIDQVLRFGDQL